MVVTVADNLVRIPILIVAVGVTVYAIVKLRLLGDALRHHFNPRKKPERHTTSEVGEAIDVAAEASDITKAASSEEVHK